MMKMVIRKVRMMTRTVIMVVALKTETARQQEKVMRMMSRMMIRKVRMMMRIVKTVVVPKTALERVGYYENDVENDDKKSENDDENCENGLCVLKAVLEREDSDSRAAREGGENDVENDDEYDDKNDDEYDDDQNHAQVLSQLGGDP